MVIQSSAINTSSNRTYTKVQAESTRTSTVAAGSISQGVGQTQQGAAFVSLSEAAQKFMEDLQNGKSQADLGVEMGATGTVGAEGLPTNPNELKIAVLQQMLEQLSGRKWQPQPVDLGRMTRSQQVRMAVAAARERILSRQLASRQVTQTHTQKLNYEYESVNYNAKGVVNTADGKSINVDINMFMSRELLEYESKLQQSIQKPVDPLVINYGGTAASLTEQKFEFDLDVDGNLDSISFAGPGSGFLALDKNGDGAINDGGELFGPQSGNGFDDLRAYDKDRNGWIDEADDIFQHLVVWSKDENGNDQLFSLKDLGVGAIYLGETDTQFTMTDKTGNAQGVMRSTSFYLKEDGGAGLAHHIDIMA